MSKFFRLIVATAAAIAGSTIFVTGVAHASFGPDMEFTMATTVTVGDTGLPASITLTNGSDGTEEGFTAIVCNEGDNPPCLDPQLTPPDDDIGINLILSCGAYGASTTCSAPDPGVFRPSLTGMGRAATECDGLVFDIVDYNPAYGALRFTPQGGVNVELADPGVGCIIDFTVDVIGFPTIDRSPGVPGWQTGQLGDVLAYSDTPGQLPGEASDSRDITVAKAQPSIITTASPTAALGSTITDTATLSGRVLPEAAADVTFELFGPDDADCTGTPVFTSTVQIGAAQSMATSEPFAPTTIGTYRWVAGYAGDRNNAAVSGACNDANESVVLTEAQPTIATTASATIRLGQGALTDTAVVAGRVNPQAGATVTFTLYGPNDATCTGTPIATSVIAQPVASGPVVSAPFTPTAPGTYRWIAAYSGDINNTPTAGACNDPGESTVVDRAQPTLSTDAGDDVRIGDAVTDTATVTGRVAAQPATLAFRLYGPNNADCSGTPVFEQLAVPFAAGAADSVTSAPFTPTVIGTYRWVVTYSGDANNEGAVGACGDPTETVDVELGTPIIVTTASPSVPVGIDVLTDSATVTGRVMPEAGATVSFRLYGPSDPTCAGTPVFQDLNVAYPVAGGAVSSAAYTPTVVGTYRWVASYSGDAKNLPTQGACGDPTESVTVTPAPVAELPATGTGSDLMARSAAGLVLAGLALVGLGRRRRELSSVALGR